MTPNQTLIDYQNALLQKNLDAISFLTMQIASVQGTIETAQSNIEFFNSQIVDFNNEIDAITIGNGLINDTIAILAG